MRLTRKIGNHYCNDIHNKEKLTLEEREEESIKITNAIYDKFGQLEDIEDELGIDLIEILGNGDFQHLVYCFTHNVPFIFAPKEKELEK